MPASLMIAHTRHEAATASTRGSEHGMSMTTRGRVAKVPIEVAGVELAKGPAASDPRSVDQIGTRPSEDKPGSGQPEPRPWGRRIDGPRSRL